LFPSSFAVIAAGLLTVALALGAFAWGWWRGQFTHADAQRHVIFDARDLHVERPWETRAEGAARAARYGRLTAPHRGEWGEGA
jgi:nitrogen fixation-related uncharacterized protein